MVLNGLRKNIELGGSVNKVTINVQGLSRTGKSTIIQVIVEALFKAGLENVGVISDVPQTFFVEQAFQEKRLKAIKDVQIEINEIILRNKL